MLKHLVHFSIQVIHSTERTPNLRYDNHKEKQAVWDITECWYLHALVLSTWPRKLTHALGFRLLLVDYHGKVNEEREKKPSDELEGDHCILYNKKCNVAIVLDLSKLFGFYQ